MLVAVSLLGWRTRMHLQVFLIIPLLCVVGLGLAAQFSFCLYSNGPRTRSPVERVTTPGMGYAGPDGVR